MFQLRFLIAVLGMALGAGSAHAALVDLGDGTVRDTDTNLIWLQDWNVNGLANFANQTAWAENLVFAGHSDWVLPDRAAFIALATAYAPLTPANTPFTNIVANGGYWTSTVAVPGVSAWNFTPPWGFSAPDPVNGELFGVAVRSGNTTAGVPEPQTLALVLAALAGSALVRRRRVPRR